MTMTQTLEDAVHEAVDAYIAGNPKSFERNESASRSMPGGNTRTVLFHPPFPLAFESGAGARLTSFQIEFEKPSRTPSVGRGFLDTFPKTRPGFHKLLVSVWSRVQ